MKIRQIEVFQLAWAPDDSPAQRSAFVRVHTDDGLWGIGEASPMQGGLASLGIIAHDLAPALIGQTRSIMPCCRIGCCTALSSSVPRGR